MIKIEQLLPLLKPGWVAMDEDGTWWWHEEKPYLEDDIWTSRVGDITCLDAFDIAPVEDWTKSLMECGK